MNISLLAAYTKNGRVIGNNGKIPWNLPSERDRFKKICSGKIVIMGRKTFEEIGKPLPYCTILVISKTLKSVPEGCLLLPSIKQAVEFIKTQQNSEQAEILIAGGQSIYEQCLPFANKIYGTEIFYDFKGNSFFPVLSEDWKKTELEIRTENKITYQYVEFSRYQ